MPFYLKNLRYDMRNFQLLQMIDPQITYTNLSSQSLFFQHDQLFPCRVQILQYRPMNQQRIDIIQSHSLQFSLEILHYFPIIHLNRIYFCLNLIVGSFQPQLVCRPLDCLTQNFFCSITGSSIKMGNSISQRRMTVDIQTFKILA